MANDNTVTLALNGEQVPLADFAQAMTGLQELMDAISGTGVQWSVTGLQVGSAITTAQGLGRGVDEAVNTYEGIARRLQRGERIENAAARAAASKIIGIINGSVTSVRFETATVDFDVFANPSIVPLESPRAEFGSVEGRIQTLSSRNGLRFVLYDRLHDNAVSCYLPKEREDSLREAWGRLALVEGLVRRDPSGRPTAIRQVSSVDLIPERRPDDFLGLVGLWDPLAEGQTSESLVRRMRDAEG